VIKEREKANQTLAQGNNQAGEGKGQPATSKRTVQISYEGEKRNEMHAAIECKPKEERTKNNVPTQEKKRSIIGKHRKTR
jgi:hypothetical protein